MKKPLEYTINRHFLIRTYNQSEQSSLIGAYKLTNVIGRELAYKLFNRALESQTDVYTVKLRRGLKLQFVSK